VTRRPFRAVLFDMDGVLVHSFEAWTHVVSAVAERFGQGPVSRQRVAEVWGQGLSADAENLYPGRTVDEIRRAYEETFPRHVDALVVNPEATLVLGRLAALGIRRGLVTNTQQSLADRIVDRKGLRASFEVVAGVVPGLREKPAPDLLLRALEGLGVPVAEALMVGDTRFDEEAARDAGIAFLRYDFAAGEALHPALAGCVDGFDGCGGEDR
jgi:HAD superfamily hydrolase (TIGR01509 family)